VTPSEPEEFVLPQTGRDIKKDKEPGKGCNAV
jgi:hypothetical protein